MDNFFWEGGGSHPQDLYKPSQKLPCKGEPGQLSG